MITAYVKTKADDSEVEHTAIKEIKSLWVDVLQLQKEIRLESQLPGDRVRLSRITHAKALLQ